MKWNNRAIEMSFAWIFSIVVGAVILFIAIYFASQLIETESYRVNTETAKQFSALLDPLQTTVEEASTSKISVSIDTRIYAECDLFGEFGNTKLQISEKFGMKDKWSERGGDISKQNSYLFAEDMIEGKTFYPFVKPFNTPFKTADMIMLYSKPYCFVNSPEQIKQEIDSLGKDRNLIAVESKESCSDSSVIVCFDAGETGCDIEVSYESGIIRKNNRKDELYFTSDLIYPAIFSSKENYECGVNRLMIRLEHLSLIYSKKAQLMAGRCNTGMQADMLELANQAKSYSQEQDFNLNKLKLIQELAEDIKTKNGEIGCQLF